MKIALFSICIIMYYSLVQASTTFYVPTSDGQLYKITCPEGPWRYSGGRWGYIQDGHCTIKLIKGD
jgi:hypothetical protein